MRSIVVLLLAAVVCAAVPCRAHFESSLFYCDTAATLIGSAACSTLSDIDPYYPVDVAVGVNGLPVIFYAPTPVNRSHSFITKRFIVCKNVDCTEVEQPRDLVPFNGLFGVDTLVSDTPFGRRLLVAGVREQLAGFPGPLSKYPVVVAWMDESGNYQTEDGTFVAGTAVNPETDPVLARLAIITTSDGRQVPAVFYYGIGNFFAGNSFTSGASNYKHGGTLRQEQLNYFFSSGAPAIFSDIYVVLNIDPIFESGTINFPLNAARALSNFHGDTPWSNDDFAFYGYLFGRRQQQSGNSPFSLDHPLPRLHVHNNLAGDLFLGVQAMQRTPLSRIRGVDLCFFIQQLSGTNPNDVSAPFGSDEAYKLARNVFNPVVQNIFSGTTNVKFLLLQFIDNGATLSVDEFSADSSSRVPHPSSPFQYNGLSSGQTLRLIDSVRQGTIQTATCEDPSFSPETAEPPAPPAPPAPPGPPARRSDSSDDNEAQASSKSERFLAYSSIFSQPSSLSSLSLPHTLVSGVANNGYPAVLGVVSSTTGEPLASGWSIVLTVCLDSKCEQQVSRYLMDSSSLHDNWGIMDDPFASANTMLSHPDGTLTIVLFVQPQGEQTARFDGASSLRGEGSTGKPLFITCLDDTCATAYLSAECPNRMQSSMPVEYYSNGQVVVTNRPFSYSFVGADSDSLLVSVRDVPLAFAANSSYAPVGIRLWRTNRYASPAGSPCTPHAVGSTALIDSTLYICTRLNVGHSLAYAGIDGWVRYYEWVDVGHSFASRLWANLPSARSPLDLTQNVGP